MIMIIISITSIILVEPKDIDEAVSKNASQDTAEMFTSVSDKAKVDKVVNKNTSKGIVKTHASVHDKVSNKNTSQDNLKIHSNASDKDAELISSASPYKHYGMQMKQQQQQNISLYVNEEKMSVKKKANSEQQGMQQSYLQPPVLEQHLKQDVWEHRHQHLKQQQYQGTAVQFKQEKVHTEHQQHMIPMEQQLYSDYRPPLQSHKVP